MKFNWQLKFDSLFEFAAPAYSDEQISWLLTEAQHRVFIDHYDLRNNKTKRGFESTEKRRRDLEQLIKGGDVSGSFLNISVSSSQNGVHPNGVFYDLPSDFLFSIEESVLLSGSSEEVLVKPVKHDEYQLNIKNPYKKPYSDLVWRMDFSREDHALSGGDDYATIDRTPKRTELITDGTSITDYRIRYLSTPPDIVCDESVPANQRHCILEDTLHRLIVDEATSIAEAAIRDPNKYQISKLEKIEGDD